MFRLNVPLFLFLFTLTTVQMEIIFAQSGNSLQATHITRTDVENTLAKAPANRVTDFAIRHVDAAGHGYLGLGVLHRPVLASGSPIRAIQHHRQSEMYYVLSGTGTLVTSPHMANSSQIDPTSNTVKNLVGPSSSGVIQKGDQRQLLQPGDVVIIPAGVAHGFSEVTETIRYLVYRIDPEKLVQLK